MREYITGNRTQLAILIDPDHQGTESYEALLMEMRAYPADLILVGGSTSRLNNIDQVCQELKANTAAPVVLFPGNHFQLSPYADGILTLALISGRNPEFLIGRMVEAAPIIQSYNLNYLPTGYIMVGDTTTSATAYMTQTQPIPADQIALAVQTALAGQYLGMQAIYLEAGSGAEVPVNAHLVTAIKKEVDIPIIVGGGIRNIDHIQSLLSIEADTIVIGTALEETPSMLKKIHQAIRILPSVHE